MSDNTSNKKRIAKNTLLLYFRMIITMIVSLYTSRVVLSALGVDDYGIYNVVGGLVALFSVISGSLSAAISRFITFELGTGNNDRLGKIFSTAVVTQIILSLIIVVLSETIGLWYLNEKMVIPETRMYAAHWLFQFSVATFVLNLISVPYNAAIIAHEKMSAFAYVAIYECFAKLCIAFLIYKSPMDRLIWYGLLIMVVALTVRSIYGVYCNRHFVECRTKPSFDRTLMKEIFGFAGWNFIGSASGILKDQGGNLLINLFAGPAVNAALGLSTQVSTAIRHFVGNFSMALNPQITKSYASGDMSYMMNLIFQGSRIGYYLLFVISLPVLLNTDFILSLWLEEVPEHTSLFVRLSLVYALSESVSTYLVTAMLATGRIRNYQLLVGGIQMLNLPISYMLLKIGFIPEIIIVVSIVLSQCCLMARLFMLKGMINLPVRGFLKSVILNVVSTSVVAIVIPIVVAIYTEPSLFRFIYLSIICVCCSLLSIYWIGCDSKERLMIKNKASVSLHGFSTRILKSI